MISNSLKTDLYELTMAAGYFENNIDLRATFELSCHTMPPNRSYLIAGGLAPVIDYITHFKFTDEEIRFLKKQPALKKCSMEFFRYLSRLKFTGNVWAMREGEVFFAQEPVLQVEAPIIQAQILETYLLSVINISSLVATKAARVVAAACRDRRVRGVVDFGSRRAHGPEAGILAARAAYLGGCLGTSNVYAGQAFGIPLYGTVAHSWVEAFPTEIESFEAYHRVFPDNTILLVDTYDTISAVEKIVKSRFAKKVKGVRLDSGDLGLLSKKVRKILDAAGLTHIKIIASGNLNEYKIMDLVKKGSPIDLFGVGTEMVTSRDYPALDLTYKLVQTQDVQGRLRLRAKYSPGKTTVPGRKQVFRRYGSAGYMQKDTIGLAVEKAPAGTTALLRPVICNGKVVKNPPSLIESRRYAQRQVSRLPRTTSSELRSSRPLLVGYTPHTRELMRASA